MARIPYRGKDTQLVSVGPSKGFDYTTLQAALDAIATAADAAADNPYLVTVAPGRYTGQVLVNSSAMSYTTVLGEPGAQLYDATGTSGDGTVRLIPASGELVDFTLDGLTVIATTTSQEVAVALGNASGGTDIAGTAARTFDRVTIRNCEIVAGHCGLDLCGHQEGVSTAAGRVFLERNRVFSGLETALSYQGNMDLLSRHNLFEAGTRAPYSVTGTAALALVAMRYNHDSGGSGGLNTDTQYVFHGDTAIAFAADGAVPFLGGMACWLSQRTGPGNTGWGRNHFSGCYFDMWYDASGGGLGTPTNAPCCWDGSGVPTRDTLRWDHCTMRLVLGANSDYTGDGYAFSATGSPGSAAACELAFCNLYVEDKAAGGGTMYGMLVNNANTTVHHHVVSNPATKNVAAGTATQQAILV